MLAQRLHDRSHEIEVVAAHPHYPEPLWGTRLRPYREVRQGIRVTRLPLWIGRETTLERYRQELTFAAALSAATPFLGQPDVLVSTSPIFAALLPALANVRVRGIPWALWLHDLLPDGATATGLVDEGGLIISLARRLERAAYHTADRIIVLSRSFVNNLVAKGVDAGKIQLIYDPATRIPQRLLPRPSGDSPLKILSMGNIGHSQGLAPLIRAFELHSHFTANWLLVVTGTGVAATEAHAEVRSPRVRMVGLLDDADLERELREADVALVSQRYEGPEFNIPSKLMNFMAYGLPVLASVDPGGEVARIVREANAGWVVDSRNADAFPQTIARLDENRNELRTCGDNARDYAEHNFTQAAFADRFERTLQEVTRGHFRRHAIADGT